MRRRGELVIVTAAESDVLANSIAIRAGRWDIRDCARRNRFCKLTDATSVLFFGDTVKFWILAGGALALIAAHAAHTFRNRRTGPRDRFTNDQVSRDWLATAARVHEDQG